MVPRVAFWGLALVAARCIAAARQVFLADAPVVKLLAGNDHRVLHRRGLLFLLPDVLAAHPLHRGVGITVQLRLLRDSLLLEVLDVGTDVQIIWRLRLRHEVVLPGVPVRFRDHLLRVVVGGDERDRGLVRLCVHDLPIMQPLIHILDLLITLLYLIHDLLQPDLLLLD